MLLQKASCLVVVLVNFKISFSNIWRFSDRNNLGAVSPRTCRCACYFCLSLGPIGSNNTNASVVQHDRRETEESANWQKVEESKRYKHSVLPILFVMLVIGRNSLRLSLFLTGSRHTRFLG